MSDIVIAEFMDEAPLAALRARYAVRFEPTLVDDRPALLAALVSAQALIVRKARIHPFEPAERAAGRGDSDFPADPGARPGNERDAAVEIEQTGGHSSTPSSKRSAGKYFFSRTSPVRACASMPSLDDRRAATAATSRAALLSWC